METTESTKVKKSVRIRLQKEAAKQAKEENSGNQGQAVAGLKNVPTSPRKMRVVADMIRGQRVNYALNVLKFEAKKGSGEPNRNKVATVTWDQVKNIAEDKMPDLNAFTIESAMKMVAGTARSMGFRISGESPF